MILGRSPLTSETSMHSSQSSTRAFLERQSHAQHPAPPSPAPSSARRCAAPFHRRDRPPNLRQSDPLHMWAQIARPHEFELGYCRVTLWIEHSVSSTTRGGLAPLSH